MSFRTYLEAVISGAENPQSYSDKENFDNLRKDKFKGAKLLKSNIGPDKLNLWEDQGYIYYLSTSNNIYRGYMELRLEHKARIAYSHSGMKGGFYKTIFENILKYSKLDEIISDTSVSISALKSYQKLSKDNTFNISVITPTNEYMKFTKKNLLEDELNRVSIKLR